MLGSTSTSLVLLWLVCFFNLFRTRSLVKRRRGYKAPRTLDIDEDFVGNLLRWRSSLLPFIWVAVLGAMSKLHNACVSSFVSSRQLLSLCWERNGIVRAVWVWNKLLPPNVLPTDFELNKWFKISEVRYTMVLNVRWTPRGPPSCVAFAFPLERSTPVWRTWHSARKTKSHLYLDWSLAPWPDCPGPT